MSGCGRCCSCSPTTSSDSVCWNGASEFTPRWWAVEGPTGTGALLAQQLVAAGERVLDVPPKLAARVRLLDEDQSDKTDKPTWAPPAGVFGPAWTALYAAIGVAGWRLWTRDAGRAALGLHVTQLALNAAWPFTFFAARNRTAALTVIAALDLTIAAELANRARQPPRSVATGPVSGVESVCRPR